MESRKGFRHEGITIAKVKEKPMEWEQKHLAIVAIIVAVLALALVLFN